MFGWFAIKYLKESRKELYRSLDIDKIEFKNEFFMEININLF